MADVMFRRIFGAAAVQQRPHLVFDLEAVVALLDDVILVEHVAQEVAVVQLDGDRFLDVGRQCLDPVAIVAAQCDVERDDILHLAGVHGAIANRGTGGSEAMQERFPALFVGAFEITTRWRSKVAGEERTGFVDALSRDLQHQVMLVLVAILFHSRRQMARKQPARGLHDAIGEMRREKAETIEQRIETAL